MRLVNLQIHILVFYVNANIINLMLKHVNDAQRIVFLLVTALVVLVVRVAKMAGLEKNVIKNVNLDA